MRKESRLGIVGLALAIFAAIFLVRSVIPTTGALTPNVQPAMSIDELHRAMDLKALPAQVFEDPV